jgi:flagellar P-ring protein FlgI
VAISHGELTIEIESDEAGGAGQEGSKSDRLIYVDKKTTLNELVKGLNAMGVSPDDLISIFQALKRNGALIGEIELI